jgi:hypothetical protein
MIGARLAWRVGVVFAVALRCPLVKRRERLLVSQSSSASSRFGAIAGSLSKDRGELRSITVETCAQIKHPAFAATNAAVTWLHLDANRDSSQSVQPTVIATVLSARYKLPTCCRSFLAVESSD